MDSLALLGFFSFEDFLFYLPLLESVVVAVIRVNTSKEKKDENSLELTQENMLDAWSRFTSCFFQYRLLNCHGFVSE